jgi:hypothetical protein
VAHELARVRLLGEQRINTDCGDQEQLTDLATVFFGLGIFTADAAFDYSQNQFGLQTEPPRRFRRRLVLPCVTHSA